MTVDLLWVISMLVVPIGNIVVVDLKIGELDDK